MSAKKEIDFEASLESLQQTVRKLESGDLSLEESLKEFEKGVRLTRECQQYLKSAELKVEKLISSSDGTLKTENFDTDS